MPLKVLVTAQMPEEWFDPLVRVGHDIVLGEGLLDHDGLVGKAREVDAIVSVLTDPIDAAVLESGARGSLRVVGNIAVGYDNIDVVRAAELGIAVCNTPGVLDAATADVTMFLILACTRRASAAEFALRSGAWTGWGLTNFLGSDLEGSTLGLVGYGRIARAVERRANGFSMRVLHHTRHDSGRPGFVADLDQLMSESDVISVHVPLTPETSGLIDARRLRLMRRGGAVVNTARGGIVDEDALVDALESGELASAGLDVFVGEPHVDARLLSAPHLILLPHIGSATWGTRSKMALLACDDVCRVLDGQAPVNPVHATAAQPAR
jgi:glyoxylate reductase